MASIKYYPNGAGGTTGADLATLRPVYTSGVYWFVNNSITGASDANAGNDRDRPLATVGQAYTNASAGDTIDIGAGHSEIISTTITVAKAGLSFVGEGAGLTLPRLTNGVAGASGPMISVEADSVMFDNIYFPSSSNASARERIHYTSTGPGGIVANCSFECSANDSNRTLWFESCDDHSVYHCTFTATGNGPGCGLELVSVDGIAITGCVFDAGSFYWNVTTGAVYVHNGACTGIRMLRTQLLNGSNVNVTITGSKGTIQVEEQSGDSLVNWTP